MCQVFQNLKMSNTDYWLARFNAQEAVFMHAWYFYAALLPPV